MPEFDFTTITSLIASRADELLERTKADEFSEESRDARLDELTVVQAQLLDAARQYVRDLSGDTAGGPGQGCDNGG